MQPWIASGEIKKVRPGWEYRSTPDRRSWRIANTVNRIEAASSGISIKTLGVVTGFWNLVLVVVFSGYSLSYGTLRISPFK
jgi:hypothetical protein